MWHGEEHSLFGPNMKDDLTLIGAVWTVSMHHLETYNIIILAYSTYCKDVTANNSSLPTVDYYDLTK